MNSVPLNVPYSSLAATVLGASVNLVKHRHG